MSVSKYSQGSRRLEPSATRSQVSFTKPANNCLDGVPVGLGAAPDAEPAEHRAAGRGGLIASSVSMEQFSTLSEVSDTQPVATALIASSVSLEHSLTPSEASAVQSAAAA